MGLPEITNIAKISQPALWFDFNKELYTFLIFVGSEGGNNDHSQVTPDQSPDNLCREIPRDTECRQLPHINQWLAEAEILLIQMIKTF